MIFDDRTTAGFLMSPSISFSKIFLGKSCHVASSPSCLKNGNPKVAAEVISRRTQLIRSDVVLSPTCCLMNGTPTRKSTAMLPGMSFEDSLMLIFGESSLTGLYRHKGSHFGLLSYHQTKFLSSIFAKQL